MFFCFLFCLLFFTSYIKHCVVSHSQRKAFSQLPAKPEFKCSLDWNSIWAATFNQLTGIIIHQLPLFWVLHVKTLNVYGVDKYLITWIVTRQVGQSNWEMCCFLLKWVADKSSGDKRSTSFFSFLFLLDIKYGENYCFFPSLRVTANMILPYNETEWNPLVIVPRSGIR